jgi:hypothetical protein
VVGGRTRESAHHECTAFLVPEPERLDVPARSRCMWRATRWAT